MGSLNPCLSAACLGCFPLLAHPEDSCPAHLYELRRQSDPLVSPSGCNCARLCDEPDQGPLDGDDHEDDPDAGDGGDNTEFQGHHEKNLTGKDRRWDSDGRIGDVIV